MRLLATVACSHWQTQHVSPEQGFAARQPAAVRLTLTDSSRLELDRPTIADSMLQASSGEAVVRVPLSRIANWSARRPGASSDVKVLAAGAGLAMLVYLVTGEPWPD
ncbi:MAG: hypothetical protein ACREOC_17740 [Gemmatimonadales bacterium]